MHELDKGKRCAVSAIDDDGVPIASTPIRRLAADRSSGWSGDADQGINRHAINERAGSKWCERQALAHASRKPSIITAGGRARGTDAMPRQSTEPTQRPYVSRRRFLRMAVLGAAGGLVATPPEAPLGAALAWAARAGGSPSMAPGGVFADLHFHASLRATVRELPVAISAPLFNRFAQLTFNRTGGSWEEAHRAGIIGCASTTTLDCGQATTMPAHTVSTARDG
jgi:hypothetical protein